MVDGKYVQQNAEPSSSEPVAPPRKMDDAFVTDELAKKKKDNELDDDYRLAGRVFAFRPCRWMLVGAARARPFVKPRNKLCSERIKLKFA